MSNHRSGPIVINDALTRLKQSAVPSVSSKCKLLTIYGGKSMKKYLALIFIAVIGDADLAAQQLYMPRNVQRAFNNGTRQADGRPGKNYWQNTGKYNISITAAPPSRTVTGTEEIVYTNNSPTPLEN